MERPPSPRSGPRASRPLTIPRLASRTALDELAARQRRPNSWASGAALTLWVALLVFVLVTLWTGHSPISLPSGWTLAHLVSWIIGGPPGG